MKAEIERIQLLLERSRERMQKDFEKWLSVMLDQRKLVSPNKVELGSDLKSVNHYRINYFCSFSDILQLPKVNDKELEKKLEAFYKARDEIYKSQN